MPVKILDENWKRSLAKLREGVARGIGDPSYGTLTVQGRLLVADMMRFTPPRNQAQGRNAIRGDFNRVVAGTKWLERLTSSGEPRLASWAKRLLQAIRAGDERVVHGMLIQSDLTIRRYIAAGAISEAHRAKRNARGRVTRGTRTEFITSSPIHSRYLSSVYARVGKARAGWLASYYALGGRGGREAPDWVSRHGTSGGHFVDGRNVGSLSLQFVEFHNRTRWAVRKDEGDRIFGQALQRRARDCTAYLRKQTELAARRAGWQVRAAS